MPCLQISEAGPRPNRNRTPSDQSTASDPEELTESLTDDDHKRRRKENDSAAVPDDLSLATTRGGGDDNGTDEWFRLSNVYVCTSLRHRDSN